MSFGGSPTGEGINLPVKWHRGDSVRACAAAEGVSRALKASDSCRPQPHHQSAGLPFTGWSGGRVGCSAGDSQRGLTSPEGIDRGTAGDVRHPRQPRRCPLRGGPRVQGHRHAAVTRCATSEGVTEGGQSALGVGLHAAEALTPGSPHSAVRGQGRRGRG